MQYPTVPHGGRNKRPKHEDVLKLNLNANHLSVPRVICIKSNCNPNIIMSFKTLTRNLYFGSAKLFTKHQTAPLYAI